MDRQEKCVLEKEALLLTYIHILSLSFSLYIYFYIYFVFFLLSTLFFILSLDLPDFGTHSFLPSLAYTHTYTFVWKYAKLYLYILYIYQGTWSLDSLK